MKKNPIRSAILWFLGVGVLTGSGLLGMIAAFIAYNATKDEMLKDARREERDPYYAMRRQQAARKANQTSPWGEEQAFQDATFSAEPHVSLRPDDKPAKTEQPAPAKEEKKPEDEAASEGKRYIASLRLAKASIDNKTIQDKIEAVEKVVESIYARVDEKPDQTAEVKDVMAKTMPLVTSVLDSYAEMNIRKVQGQEFTKMEGDVIDLLDKTRAAYTRLYDNMYDGDIMDVSSDISVLKTLLSQEGLLGGDFEAMPEQGELRRQTQ